MRSTVVALTLAAAALLPATSASAKSPAEVKLQRQIDALARAPGGPPGVVVTLRRGSRTTVLTSGVSDIRSRRAPGATDHMRIASITKAFSGAIAFDLVRRGLLTLSDTLGEHLRALPRAWAAVTVRQMLNHTSGLPDYTTSTGFHRQFKDDPAGFVPPTQIIRWVESAPLRFAPGTRYVYSNTDNIVIGLIAEQVTRRSYARLLREIVFRPLGLQSTSFPSAPPLPRPFIHGYLTQAGRAPEDVSTLLSPSGAWASGAIVATPNDLNAFISSYVSGRRIPPRLKREQMHFVPGQSSPPGPGANAAGLAIFRYRTRCGTVYGHTGDFPGYVQFAAASRDGRRAVTTSLNIPAPTRSLLSRLRRAQETAVCALLGAR